MYVLSQKDVKKDHHLSDMEAALAIQKGTLIITVFFLLEPLNENKN